jgi:methionyl-tRNA synthetase
MPYGNKELHFGHIGGVFVHADTFARFLRDRIGSENVIFVSGTDCYGSPILESYRKLMEDSGETSLTLEEYVGKNHEHQKETLEQYQISLNLYAASALGRAGEIHQEVSVEIFNTLYEKGCIEKRSTPQFFDKQYNVMLNGRQVIGRCPIEGCTSDKGYADECSLGHQYMPSELIQPKSTLSGNAPDIVEVENWYFKLEEYKGLLQDYVKEEREYSNTRKYILNTIEEFLKQPYIYVKKSQLEGKESIKSLLPTHKIIDEEKKSSYTFIFDHLEDRDKAREIFSREGIFIRTGKTLVPFRLSGNIDWGVKLPSKDGLKDLTFWVWPESLWAPISFTKAYLEGCSKSTDDWKRWWKSKESKVYQFIGEDNIYFYGIAEMALFHALGFSEENKNETIFPHLIANRHVLFLDKKASSSGNIKPPMARDLLAYYTPEQLRFHFLSLGLSNKSVSFNPQVYLPKEEQTGMDIVLKDGNLLTNVFNRLVRSCFYTALKYFDNKIPFGYVSDTILKESENALLDYERHMYEHEFHSITYVLDTFVRNSNKYWVNQMRQADSTENNELRKQVLIDSFHVVKTAALMFHPIAPIGCDKIRDYLNIDQRFWDWKHAFTTIDQIIPDFNNHRIKTLEAREDFFVKHESQFEA